MRETSAMNERLKKADTLVIADTQVTKRFLSIAEAAKVTGISSYAIRQGVRGGLFPAVRVGQKFLVNIPALLEVLDNLSHEQGGGVICE